MFRFDEVQQCYLNEIFFISAILKSFEAQQWDRLLGKAVMFLFLLGKHDCLFGMVGLWWCWIQLSLPGEYGVVRAQYYRICLGVLVLYTAWILYLLVLTQHN